MKTFIALFIVLAAVFGVCFLVDKVFTKLFRGKTQHSTGKAVKVNKKFGSIGLILIALGLAGAFAGFGLNWLLFVAGLVLIAVGAGLVIYYMSFGIYYDEDSFILSTFGKKSITYQFGGITGQQLYTSAAGIIIELYLPGEASVQLQPGMTGVDAFMNHAFAAWVKQTGRTQEECDFYDPDNSCWFPPVNE